eukprot:g2735.t1
MPSPPPPSLVASSAPSTPCVVERSASGGSSGGDAAGSSFSSFTPPPSLTIPPPPAHGFTKPTTSLAPPKTPKILRGRTAVHDGILAGDSIEKLSEILEQNPELLDAAEEHGFTPLMSASVLHKEAAALEVCGFLCDRGCNKALKDHDGYTALHWAVAEGSTAVVRLLLDRGADKDAVSKGGETPLHRACRYGKSQCIGLLVEAGASLHLRNNRFETAMGVAGKIYETGSRKANATLKDQVRSALLRAAPQLRTGLLYHLECREHRTKEGHFEAPERLDAIMGRLRTTVPDRELWHCSDFSHASVELLKLAHSEEYIRFVFELSQEASLSKGPVPFTPRVQEGVVGTPPDKVKADETCDTSFSRGTLGAALRAVGGCVKAVDVVVEGAVKNAMAVVRPPGHHAGVQGLLQSCISCGFCIFNGVAIAALHALSAHSDTIKRVAIVDFDVHHGNGTQEIVQQLGQRHPHLKKDQIFFTSIHLCDPGFYPDSGQAPDLLSNVLNRVEERVLPALRAHCPDLILLSSGFDGGKHDVGNQGITKGHSGYFQPGLDLSAADFDWLTKQLMHVADICCDGKIVSVLEGGYGKWNRDAKKGGLISAPVGAPRRPTIDRDTLGRYATAHIAALCSST